LSDIPFKECFSFAVDWTISAVSSATKVKIETKCAFNKSFLMGGSLVESAMDKYLMKLANKWQKQAKEYIDSEVGKVKRKNRGLRVTDGLSTLRQRLDAPVEEIRDHITPLGKLNDSNKMDENAALLREKRKKRICCCFC
jgi:hypothetical protein